MAKNNTSIYNSMIKILERMKENPETVSENDRNILNKIYQKLCRASGISEHVAWEINYMVEKWHSTKEKNMGILPYEVVHAGQNVILDSGANEILKLICGAGTPYNNANAKIYVGTDSTAESVTQSGILATGNNRAIATMDTGSPSVSGRTAVFRATFGEGDANFEWNEACIVNGTGANSVSMNRKVSQMGTKNGGTWTIQITINLVPA